MENIEHNNRENIVMNTQNENKNISDHACANHIPKQICWKATVENDYIPF